MIKHYHDYEYPNYHDEIIKEMYEIIKEMNVHKSYTGYTDQGSSVLEKAKQRGSLKAKYLHEVLQEHEVVSGDKWFRPISWKGYKSAYEVEDNKIYAVPSCGRVRIFMTEVHLLTGFWEAVTPDEVLSGN